MSSALLPQHVLFSGEIHQVKLTDGSTYTARVLMKPARHLLALMDFFDMGREAELLERTVEVQLPEERSENESVAQAEIWIAATPAWIDSLDDVSQATLNASAEKLNFQRAVVLAERQIARGKTLRDLKERQAKEMLTQLRPVLDSLMSSLTQQLSLAAAKPKS